MKTVYGQNLGYVAMGQVPILYEKDVRRNYLFKSRFPVLAEGVSYYWKSVIASSSVTRPISMGSISDPTSRLGRNGPKNI